jgi:Fic family protein
MDEKAFNNPNGRFVKNGDGNKTFLPKPLPPTIYYDSSLASLSSEAHAQLGRLSGIGELLPNPDVLIRPYLRREAVLSSKIEGTQASIADVFEYEAKAKTDSQNKDQKRVIEVVNYVRALSTCIKRVEKGEKISLDMIKDAHKMLMRNVIGQEISPGQFRTVQNWIGQEGSKIDDAIYVPPSKNHLQDSLLQLEQFIEQPKERIPVLIQTAFVHYQFEAIHPFADGNGRIGRLLIPLILAERHVLSKPLLYLSAYFERNRTEYYKHLLNISQKSTWLEWVRFYLIGVIEQSTEAIENIRKLVQLRSTFQNKLKIKKASGNTILLVERLFANPFLSIPTAAKYLELTYPAAKNAVENLVGMGILEEAGSRQRNKLYVSRQILKVLRA